MASSSASSSAAASTLPRGEYELVGSVREREISEDRRIRWRLCGMAVVAPGTLLTVFAFLAATRVNDVKEADHASLATKSAMSDLYPLEHRRDGNVCEDNEELYGGLCYKKCSHLTQGAAPIRGSAFSCCASYPCKSKTQVVQMTLPCHGFDVSGRNTCPHAPGACLTDEEMFLGLCYKKCSLLSQGEYPNRVGSATCCKQDSLECFNPVVAQTKTEYNVGGGMRGDRYAPDRVHSPIKELTEGTYPLERQSGTDASNESSGISCKNNEELHGGLCYKKCSVLTDAEFPVRGSAFACCRESPCSLYNQKLGGLLMCRGYDVSGEGGCPKPPGMCLPSEELFLGVCYTKCSFLTDGEYPYRASSVTCCKTEGLSCMNPFGSDAMTRFSFSVAGGESPRAVHGPIKTAMQAV